MNPKKATLSWHLTAALALTAAVFGVDLFVPLGFAGGVPYLFPLLVSLRSSNPHHTLIVAAAGTALTTVGFLFSPSGGVLWIVVLNRLLALLVIWVTAILSLKRKRAEMELEKTNAELEERVLTRTARLAALAEVTKRLTSGLRLDDVLHSIAVDAAQLFGGEAVFRLKIGDTLALAATSANIRKVELVERPHLSETTSGVAVAKGTPLVVPDITSDQRAHPIHLKSMERLGLGAVMHIPLMRDKDKEAVGVLSVWREKGYVFDEATIEIANTLADQAVIAIENSSLYQESKERAERLEIVGNIAKAVGSELDPDELFHIIAKEIQNVVSCDRCVVGVFEPETKTVHQFIEDTEHPIGIFIPEEDYRVEIPLQQLYRTNRPVDIPDVLETKWRETRLAKAGYRSLLFIPVTQGELCVAYVHLASRAVAAFSFTHIELLTSVATHLEPAIRNASLYGQSELRGGRLAALVYIGKRITEGLNLDEVLELVVENASRVLEGETLFRLREGDELVISSRTPGMEGVPLKERLQFGESVFGWATTHKTPRIVTDPASDERIHPAHREAFREKGIETLMHVPLVREGEVLGLLSVLIKKETPFHDEDLDIAISLADQAAIAIENARLHGEAGARASRLEVVGNISRAVSSELEPNDLFKTIVDEIRSAIPCDRVSFASFDAAEWSPIFYFDDDLEHPDTALKDYSYTGLLAKPVYQTNKPNYIPDISKAPWNQGRHAKGGYRSALVVPIVRGSRCIAHIFLASRKRDAFTDDQAELLASIANHLGPAIRNASLYQAAEERAERLAVLNELNQTITQHLDLGEVLDNMGQATLGLISADRAQIFLYDESSSMLVSHSSVGSTSDSGKTKNSFKPGEGLVGIVFQSGQPMICSDILQDPRLVNAEWFKMRGLNSHIGQLLYQAGNVIGVINAFSGPVDSFDG